MRLRAVSGTGAKAPACFLVETNGIRLLLDLGEGPDPGLVPDLDTVGRIDAVLLSHIHNDHAGALHLRSRIGNPPVYVCRSILHRLPRGIPAHPLPLRGTADVLGLRVTCGRNGHAPSGTWLHIGSRPSLLYTGDWSPESAVYAFDPPPAAEVVIIDASYGDDDVPLRNRISTIDAALAEGPALLPVPPLGRGPEIALHISERFGRPPAIDDAMRDAVGELLGPSRESVHPGCLEPLARLRDEAPSVDDSVEGIAVVGGAQCSSGSSARLIERYEDAAAPKILFTGYVAADTPAKRLLSTGRASQLRWSVHPRISDNAALVADCRARLVIPAFAGPDYMEAWKTAFAPATVSLAMTEMSL